MAGQHAKLSASACERWSSCPGSIRMIAGLPGTSSVYAAEGTAAHTLAEQCVNNGRDAAEYVDRVVDVEGQKFTVDEEMAEAVQVYLDYVRADLIRDGVEWEVEARLDNLQNLHPDLGGTADFSAYDPATKHLTVVDYKHGRGVAVDAEHNLQELTYALGVATRYHNRGLAGVKLVIVQPRCPHPVGRIRAWDIDAVTLLEFSADLVDAAKKTEAPDAPLSAGEHCKFCPAAGFCPALRDRALQSAMADFANDGSPILPDPVKFKPEQLSSALREVDLVEDWCRRVRELGHHEAEAGRCPPGFKLVGTRPTRKWKDEQAARDYLAMSLEVEPEHMLTEPNFRSPAQMESVLKEHYGLKGKKAGEAIVSQVIKSSSGTVLAPADDPREAVRPEAANEFSVVTDEQDMLAIPAFLRRSAQSGPQKADS